ncbi:MAG: ABC transporter ATP-binding protein [Lachnospiraceae bacterium]|nr:ABC transporter ATP-binding protein [Lachnospiraceae bacterium]
MPPISTKTDKPRNTKKALGRIMTYISSCKVLFIIAVILAVAGNVLALIGPNLSGKAIDVIAAGKGQVDFNKIYYYVGLMIVFYVISVVMSYALSVIMIKVARSIAGKMRQDVFEKLMKLPVGYFDKNQAGDIISRVSYDIDVINSSISTDVVQIVSSLVTIVFSLVMMFVISKSLMVVVLVTLPVSIIYTKYMSKRTRPLFSKRSKSYGRMNGFTEEMFSGHKSIQAYANEEGVIDDFAIVNMDAADAYYNADYMATLIGPSVNFINNLSLALVAIVGALLYLFGNISVGSISSFVLYSRKFSGPVNEIANMLNEILSALAAAERVFAILDEPEEAADSDDVTDIDNVKGEVEFDNVSFGYDANKMILKNVNLKAKPGQVIAIVGPTGAGKTTTISLLMRFYEINKGSIYLDGVNIQDMARKSLRKAYTMVLQDTWIFNGTIRDNIAYAKENATDEEVIAAAKAARLHSYIMTLPKGYDTVINGDGNNISKGQKQLITIARAMLDDSALLILDEATSNVDTRTEKAIQKAMLELMKGKTSFVIAHRLSTIQNADLILVVKDGNIVEQGTHESLLDTKGVYYEMYSSQYM